MCCNKKKKKKKKTGKLKASLKTLPCWKQQELDKLKFLQELIITSCLLPNLFIAGKG